MKIILGGPPRSGKSCLKDGLKNALTAQLGPDAAIYPYIIDATPDGEGSWFAQTARQDSALARQLKTDNKSTDAFNPLWVTLMTKQVANCSQPLTIIDIGGKISDENRKICAAADSAILIAPTEADLGPWREFCRELNLAVIAEAISDAKGSHDSFDTDDGGVLRGRVHNLQRTTDSSTRPFVRALAAHVLERITSSRPPKTAAQNATATELNEKAVKIAVKDEILRIGYGRPASGEQIAREMKTTITALKKDGQLPNGPLLRINGPTTLGAAMVLANELAGTYQTIAMYDPKLDEASGKYVVVASRATDYQVGDRLP